MKRLAFFLIPLLSTAGVLLFCLLRHQPGCRPSTLDGVHEGLKSLACSPDGRTFITGGALGDLQLWDVSKKSVRRRIVTGHDGVTAVAYSADSSIVASGGEEGYSQDLGHDELAGACCLRKEQHRPVPLVYR